MLALFPGLALGADQDVAGVVAQGLPVAEDGTLELPGSDPGSGLDLNQILPLELAQPPQDDGGQQTTAPAASSPASAAPKPAASAPKRRKPARATADAGSERSRGHAVLPTQSNAGPRRAERKRAAAPSDAPRRAIETAASTEPSGAPGPARPSIVNRVIDRIPAEYKVALVALGLLSLLFAGVSLRERRRSRRVEQQAMIDSLTALPNRQAFERRLAKEWRRAERYERSIGVLMIDLDDFKQINDSAGHAAGDRVLAEAAMLISGRIRSADMPARWGGDEFVVLCPETDTTGLKVLARSLEDRLRHAGIASSAGFAEVESGDLGPSDLLARADVSMYARKQRDRARPERRRVTVADARASFAPLSD